MRRRGRRRRSADNAAIEGDGQHGTSGMSEEGGRFRWRGPVASPRSSKALAAVSGALEHLCEPPHAGAGHEEGDGEAYLPAGVVGGAEVFHGQEVLDFHGAGGGHGEGAGAEGERGGDEAAGEIGLFEEADGHRVDGEGDHEDAYAAVGQNGAGEYDAEGRVAYAEFAHDGAGDAVGGSTVLHDLAEHGSEEEHGEPVTEKAGETGHVAGEEAVPSFGGGQEERNAAREGDGDATAGARRGDVHPANCEGDQQGQAANQPGHAEYHCQGPSARCRGSGLAAVRPC